MPPFLRSAIIVTVGLFALQIVNVLTVGIALLVSYPLLILIYIGNGALAGYFANQDGIVETAFHQGLLSGLVVGVLEWIIYGLLISVFGVLTIGFGYVGLIACLCAPVDIIIAAGFSGLGSWIVGRTIGPEDVDAGSWSDF